MKIFKYILIISSFLASINGFAQTDSTTVLGGGVEEKKPQKDTLNTYLFDEWHKKEIIFSWKHNPYLNTVKRIPVYDTLPNDVRVEYPFFKRDVGATFLGSPGSAVNTFDFFQQERTDEEFIFFRPYEVYTFHSDDQPFFNVKRAFSVISYQTSGSQKTDESDIRVLLTQNITPEWNMGLMYQRYGIKDYYTNGATDNKVFSLFGSYVGTRYAAHGAYIIHNIDNKENGGLRDDYYITDTVMESENIDVNLLSARNRVRKRELFFTHSLAVPLKFLNKKTDVEGGEGSLIYFGNALEYTTYNRRYKDVKSTSTGTVNVFEDTTYYQHWYYNARQTRDSTYTSIFDARLFFKLQPWAKNALLSAVAGGAGFQSQKYYSFNPNYYLAGEQTESKKRLYLYGNASGMFSKYFSWNAFSKYFVTGKTDFLFDGNVKISFYPLKGGVHLTGRFFFRNYEPDYFLSHYHSNHLTWTNSLDNITRTQLEAELSIPDWNLTLGAKQALIKNYTYLDTASMPRQYSDNLSVTSFWIQKNFKLGLMHFDNQLLLQFSGNEDVLPVPKFSAHLAWYLQATIVKKVLVGQFGLDARYNTSFYNYAYNPAAGLFSLQNEKKIGNFPYIELFANFKWKRTVIFAKVTNLLKDYFDSNYFSALHYARNNVFMFRLGITWHFYN